VCLCCWCRSPIESVRGQQSGMMNANLFLIKGGPCFICRWVVCGWQEGSDKSDNILFLSCYGLRLTVPTHEYGHNQSAWHCLHKAVQ
jgi:hypothetical protein